MPSTAFPPTVAITELVVLVYDPGVAPAGTCIGTVMVQLPLGGSRPPDSLRVLPPDKVLPIPHTSLTGNPEATNPVKAASKSSVKLIFVASCVRLKLTIVNSIFPKPPGLIGFSINRLVRCNSD